MDNWITIQTFTLPSEAAVLQARLESEGIECFLQNEHTVHVNPFFSNAVGGVHLQVREKDLDAALEILRDGGYITESKIDESNWLKIFDKISGKILFLKKQPMFIRPVIIVAAAVGLLTALIFYLKTPTTYEKLTTHTWCLDYITYGDKDYSPNTTEDIRLIMEGACNETISFRESGMIILPGFNSPIIGGRWQLEEGLLRISNVDTFDYVLNGTYEIDFDNDGLTLESEKTILQCHAQHLTGLFR